MPSHLLERLRVALHEGTGAHHDVSGVCAVDVIDRPELGGQLRFSPGEVAAGPAEGAARGRLRVTADTLEQLLAGIEFDFRMPAVAPKLSFEGDVEFVVRNVVLSLRRPTDETREKLRRAEAFARGNPRAAAFTAVERISRPTAADFRDQLAHQLPFIVTGALGDWPATRSFEAWVEQRARVGLAGLVGGSLELGAFVRRARERRDVTSYTHGAPLPRALRPDFPPPPFVAGYELLLPQLWLGAPKNAQTPITTLHRDVETGLLGHVHGRKRFTVFAPHQADCLYPRPAFDSYQHCWASPHEPDLARHPRFRDARGVDFMLDPGELLVMPPGWFHCVHAVEPFTASVSYFVKVPLPAGATSSAVPS